MEPSEVKDQLHQGVCYIEFVKKDGSIREGFFTLNEEFLPETDGVEDESSKDTIKKQPDNLIIAYEIDVGWRSFYSDKITHLTR